jgi:hypothetical protein
MARWPEGGRKRRAVTSVEVGDAPTLNAAEQLAEDYRVTFSTESGARVLDDLKKRFGDRRSFVPDSNATAFHEGQRDVYRLCVMMQEKDVRRTEAKPAPTEGEDDGSSSGPE